MSHWVVQDEWYHGSRLLQPLADAAGVQVDKLNYVVAGFSCILIGSIYRTALHPSKVTPLARKLFTFLVGVLVLYFCFGGDVIHLFVQTTVAYLLIVFCPIEPLPRFSLYFCLGYQSILHGYRMYYDYQGYTLDITGALMMLTQRLTSLAFSFRDGVLSQNCKPYMLKDAIKKRPDVFTYFTYAFDFHMVLCGPLIPFKEVEAVTYGTIFDERKAAFNKNAASGGSNGSGIADSAHSGAKNREALEEPDPTPYVFKRTIYSVLSILVVVFVVPLFPIEFLFSEEFKALALPTKVFWFFVYTALTRQQYYLIWKMAEAICNSSHFGYRYVNGADDWSGCTNIRIWDVETALSQRDGLAAWNTSTQRWLRSICYDRVETSKTLMTFFLSAAWHGFYPGYYLTFMTLAVQTLAARNVRRYVRPHFQGSTRMKKLYDAMTFLTTVWGFAYATLPFILLSFSKAFTMWSHVYFYGHVFSAFCIFALPRILPKPAAETSSESLSTSSKVSKTVKQG
ncbi:membrane-bound O-acyltransferase domain-containing protein 2 [Galendromus occidentalis]|uniref:Membrane-bound O-acyltransferase domain-containing protein 2 n=1 Tax=Galendromus occidentalis TaxID=34638 RepID=A0AAJ7L518_9ACAR|nr:membrane-bound O-acyltransferase domain-containing protein 2 [Galendromus occidentalis]